jgi:hypothetical protein
MYNIYEQELKKVLDETINNGNIHLAKKIMEMCNDTFSEKDAYNLKILLKEIEIKETTIF